MSLARTYSAPSEIVASAFDGQWPMISVVVPIRNEQRFIGHTLEELLRQDYDPDRFEIIVVDGQSTDMTREVVQQIVDRHPQVRLVPNPRQWSSVARNVGVVESEGDLVLVVDAHCELETDQYFKRLAAAFARSGADCLGRPQPLDVSRATVVQQDIAAARASFLGHHPASYIYSDTEREVPAHSVAVAYRREVFDRLGLFDERFDACEDVEFNHRIDKEGLKCFLTPQLRVRYYPRADLKGLMRQMFRYGRGRGRLFRKHPDTFSPGSFVPACFVAGLVVGPICALFSPILAAVFFGCVAFYAALVLLVSLGVALTHPRGWRMAPWLPLVFLAVHLGAGAGVLEEVLLGPFRLPPGGGAPVFYPRHVSTSR